MAARAGVKPTTLRLKVIVSTKAPPRPLWTASQVWLILIFKLEQKKITICIQEPLTGCNKTTNYILLNVSFVVAFWKQFERCLASFWKESHSSLLLFLVLISTNFENPCSQRCDVTNGVRISRAILAIRGYPSIWQQQKLESVVVHVPLYQRPLVECGSAAVL